MKRVIVAGGRDFGNYPYMKRMLDRVLPGDGEEIEVVSGHAKGADRLGERYAEERGLRLRVMPADWKALGRLAGVFRNQRMLEYAMEETPMVVAFWNGVSRGTADMIRRGGRAGVRTVVFGYGRPSDAVTYGGESEAKPGEDA